VGIENTDQGHALWSAGYSAGYLWALKWAQAELTEAVARADRYDDTSIAVSLLIKVRDSISREAPMPGKKGGVKARARKRKGGVKEHDSDA